MHATAASVPPALSPPIATRSGSAPSAAALASAQRSAPAAAGATGQHELHVGVQLLAVDAHGLATREPALRRRREAPERTPERAFDSLAAREPIRDLHRAQHRIR